MAENSGDTRSGIIRAARNEFMSHGFEGARLQPMADQIGVTKAMIHYYFDTKQKLFEEVYSESVSGLFEKLPEILDNGRPLFEKLDQLIKQCLHIAEQHPEQLAFIVIESRRKPDRLIPLFRERYAVELHSFEQQLNRAAENYEIAAVDVRQLLLNIFSLCFYPALSPEINRAMLKPDSGGEISGPAQSRQGIVLDTILNWLTS